MGKYLDTLIGRNSLLNEISENQHACKQREKTLDIYTPTNPQKVQKVEISTNISASTNPQKVQKSNDVHRWCADNDNERAVKLLAKYRRSGAMLSLEEIEHGGATWLALACDLENVAPDQRESAFEAMQRNARILQRALELEGASASSGATLCAIR